MSDPIARRICVHGRVQGVWFRDWAIEQAKALGLDGWVRNRADGTVELVVKGTSEGVEAITAACRTGSPNARVDQVDVEETPGIVAPGFRRKPTV